MFYENQPKNQKEKYKQMLTIMGNLSSLFSDSDCPYLPYRAHENIFCKYFDADNLSRADNSADAKKGSIGIGLKTWVGGDDQKIAEFGKLRSTYENSTGLDLVKKISTYRNERIRVTKNLYGIDMMIYHIVRRIPNCMQIIEYAFDPIDIDNIVLIDSKNRNPNNTYFSDGKHTYHFSTSKNTLYMIFSEMNVLDSFEVDIMSDPYDFLLNAINNLDIQEQAKTSLKLSPKWDKSKSICLRLYSTCYKNKRVKPYVPKNSGLNQWNAKGRPRDPNEIYIPYNAIDRQRIPNFFPPKDVPFSLILPNGTIISAKVCQENSKAIMSNPNKLLGEWLLRDVLELAEGSLVTYEMLMVFGIDSVVITKIKDGLYSIDFSPIGTYDDFYSND